ncbi:MAG: methyltransferase domain-containing protein [Planctomycetota bacterium]|nr:methyltransferase domain-containing protein [Planctomycetota bacterium]
MNDFSLFLGKFVRHGTAIASLAPSSPWLSRATVRNVDWARARVVVELGAGTGPITKVIAEKAHPDCRLIILERDHDFAELLCERFNGRANLEVIEGDVRDLADMLHDRGIAKADYVISGLPVPSFPKELQSNLFRVVGEVLDPAGSFNQITEMPLVYWLFYKKFFEDVRFTFEPRNFPPAGAYFCKGVKLTTATKTA